ncbi:MAG TPA: ABC transporter substrate-binding protein [Chloroflexota bacterium]|nr:ABC transporter substrate-binding protein [Chloroflexota bacterium]
MNTDRQLSQELGQRLSRRILLRRAVTFGGASAVIAVLAACQQAAPPAAPATAKPAAAPTGATAAAPAAAPAATSAPAAASAEGTPKRGGTLRYGLSTDPSNFEPHVSTGAASGTVKLMVMSTLLTYSPDGKLIGDLVDSFGWADNTTYEMKLKKGVLFHDGSELTTDDVIFSFQRIMNPATTATNAPRLADVDNIEAGEGNVVRFRLKQPNATLPYVFADNSSVIVSRKWIESGVDPKSSMMGSGPFKFVDRQPGLAVNLTRNDRYFLPNQPYLDAITFIPMADDTARVTALRSGSVDFIDYVPFTQMDIVQKSSDLVFKSDKVLGFNWLAFVNDTPPVNDLRVRQAFAYGMNRDKMAEVAFAGHGEAITGGLIPKGWVGYAADLEGTFKPDFEKAKSLLQQAGQPTLNIDILSTSTYSVISRPAEAAQAELKQANINGNLVMQEWLTFRQTVQAGTYPTHVWGTAPAFNDPDFLAEYVGSTGFFAKQIHFKDDQIDKLLIQGRQTLEDAKRNQIYQDIQKRIVETMPWLYLIRREQGEAMQKYVKGYTHMATGAWTQITLRETWLDK